LDIRKKVFTERVIKRWISCLINLITCNEVIGSTDKGRAKNVVYFHFNKDFDVVSQSILIDKLMEYGLDKWTENWLNCSPFSSVLDRIMESFSLENTFNIIDSDC